MQQGASREQAKRRALPTPHKYAWLCVAVPNTALSVNRPRGHSSEGESVGGLQRSGGLMGCSVGAQRNTASHQTETECSPAKSVARTHVLPTEGDTHEQARSKQGASKAEGFAHTAQVRTQPLKGVVVGVGIGRGLGSPGSDRLEPRTRLMPKRWNFGYIYSVIHFSFRIIFSHDILIFHSYHYITSYTLILVSFVILIGGAKTSKNAYPPKYALIYWFSRRYKILQWHSDGGTTVPPIASAFSLTTIQRFGIIFFCIFGFRFLYEGNKAVAKIIR